MRQFFILHKKAILIFFILGFLAAWGSIVILSYFFSDARFINKNSNGASNTKDDGYQISNGRCQGEDKPKLGTSPMEPDDFSYVIPYGLMVGGHVTPIDHQYFSPADFNSPLDAYPVYAMADARLVDVQPRTFQEGKKKIEYRMVFSLSCKLFYYYDLVTSLAGNVKSEYDSKGREINLEVKEGELIGYIGGQTLDFAVWDMDVILPGFLTPSLYVAESWKIHTVDPLLYYTDELKTFILSRYVRTAEPISGKIDYDIDGKLIGNWFVESSGGYGGSTGGRGGEYWGGHLAIAPDHWDPTHFIISIGDFGGEAQQFAARGNAPKPEDVGIESGLVKYDLTGWNYTKTDGSDWDRKELIKGVIFVESSQGAGCFLVEMFEARKLKAEGFPGKSCSQVSGFTSSAKIYER